MDCALPPRYNMSSPLVWSSASQKLINFYWLSSIVQIRVLSLLVAHHRWVIDSLEIAHLICKCRSCIKTDVRGWRGCSSKPDMGVNLCGFVGPGDRNGGVSRGRETVVHLNVQARRCSFLGTLGCRPQGSHSCKRDNTHVCMLDGVWSNDYVRV
jgi:hypothetical protein